MAPDSLQIPMDFENGVERPGGQGWLGLAVDHQRLFGALEDGWLRPRQSRSGVLLGVRSYRKEACTDASKHPVSVRVKLNPAKLPPLETSVWRDKRWVSFRSGEFQASDIALYWPGALPVFAISELEVAT